MQTSLLFRNLITAFAGLALLSSPVQAAATKIGVIGAASGMVTARDEHGVVRPLKAGDDVYLNDTVVSGDGSKAQIMFLDKSALMINPGSEVRIDTFVYDPAASTGDLTINSAKGALRFIGGALSKEKPVKIKTPVATIGIRGGIADTHVAQGGATDAIFVYGKELTMQNAEGGQVMSVTTVGQGLTLSSPQSIPAPLPPEKIAEHISAFSEAAGGSDGDAPNQGTPAPAGDANSDTPAAPTETDPQGNNDATGSTAPQSQGEGDNKSQPTAAAKGDGKPSINGPRPMAGSPPPPMMGTNTLTTSPVSTALPPLPPINNTEAAIRETNIANVTGTSGTQPILYDRHGQYVVVTNHDEDTAVAGLAETKTSSPYLPARFTQNYPDAQPAKLANLPWLANSGTQSITTANPATMDGRSYTGVGYSTPDQAMQYYRLHEMGGVRDVAIVTGRDIAPGSWNSIATASANAASAAGHPNVSFYRFLPDLASIHIDDDGMGFFDYALLAGGPQPTGTTLNPDNPGLMVNWTQKRFITGNIQWNNNPTNSNVLLRDMMLAFGTVNTGGVGNLLSGKLYEFNRYYDGTGNDYALDNGVMRVANNVYAPDPNSPITGFSIEGVFQESDQNSPAGTTLFTNPGDGDLLYQPVVRSSGTTEAISAAANRTTEQQKGFAAGYMVKQIGNSLTFREYISNNPDDVAIYKDATANTAGGAIKMYQSSTSNTVTAKFGHIPSQTNADNAYIGDQLYAAQQDSVTYVTSGVPVTYSGNDASNGVLVAANAIADVNNTCTSCEFVHWGVWAGEVYQGTNNGIIDIAPMIPYVAGNMTQNLSTNVVPQNFGAVNYSGAVYGQILDGNSIRREDGTFTAGVNLNTRSITDYSAHLAGMNFGFTGQNYTLPSAGNAVYSHANVYNLGGGSPGNINGTVSVGLFGPNAENVAGNFGVTDITQNIDAAGVYLGARP